MVRGEQGMAAKGSQRWLQLGVNRHPETLNNAIGNAFGFFPDEEVEWRSPLEKDSFAEYCDSGFLSLLGLELERHPLGEFWPRRGPVWDGLAVTNRGRVILVEAKANTPEFNSSPTGAGERSLGKIRQSLNEVREFLKVRSGSDWTQCFYQYANRLAHLYLLRELNGIDAKLAFVYFVNDRSNPPRERYSDQSHDEWGEYTRKKHH